MGWRGIVLVAAFACNKAAKPKPMPADAVAVVVDAAVPDAAPPKWGAPVSDPAAERAVLDALAAIAGGKAKPGDVLTGVFSVGPGLWQRLKTDPKLAKLGTDAQVVMPGADKPQQLEMRSFLDAKAQKALLANPNIIALAKLVSQAKARPANDVERALLYALVPFEIAGKPITILETADFQLLVYAESNKLAWIDSPGSYSATK
jgi:hypothetical protein